MKTKKEPGDTVMKAWLDYYSKTRGFKQTFEETWNAFIIESIDVFSIQDFKDYLQGSTHPDDIINLKKIIALKTQRLMKYWTEE